MSNMLQTIVPKSDQLNADSLIGQSLTIRVTKVVIKADEQQSVWISYEGDAGRPYKPCMSMRRVLVQAWGPDANHYVGRSMTLCRDPNVKWAGEAVGGIRISHLSHIEKPFTMALTATRGSRKPYTVEVLAGTAAASVAPTVAEYDACDGPGYKLLESRRKETYASQPAQLRTDLESAKKRAFDRLSAQAKASAAATQPELSAFDPAACLQHLTAPSDAAALESAWTAAMNHYGALDQQVPVEMHAAYTISKEQFAE